MPAPANSTNRRVVGLAVSTGVIWGSGGLISKAMISAGVDPFVMTALPFGVGAVVAWLWTLTQERPSPGAIRDGLILGATNSALPAMFFNLAYVTAPAGIVGLILSLGPVFTAVAAHFAFADESFSARKGMGLVLSITGVGVLVFSPESFGGASPWGAGSALMGALIGGLTAITSRRMAVRHGASNLVAAQLSTAGLVPLVLAVALGRELSPTGGWQTWQLVSALMIGVVASFGGFRMIMLANQLGTTGQVSLVGYVIPLVAVIGGAIFLDETLTPFTIAGAALILAGIYLVGGAVGKPARLVRSAR